MNPNISQTPKVFASVEPLTVYPATTLPANKQVMVYFTDSTSQLATYANISNQVNSLTAQLALLTSIKAGIATALDITE